MPDILNSQLCSAANGKDDLPSVLIIGSDPAHRQEFLARLHALSSTTDTTENIGVAPTLQLDTKYYTASVALVDAAPESAAQHPTVATAEGVILLLSGQDARAFDTLTQAVQSADANADVQLCVYDGASRSGGANAAQPAICTEGQQWAAQELYEYIAVDTADAAADADLQLDGEPQGMRRVLAALEAHMWSGLHLKPPPSANSSSGIDSGSSAAMADAAGHAGRSTGQPSPAGPPLAVSTASDTANGAAGDSGKVSGAAHAHEAGEGRDAGAHDAFGSFMGAEEDPDLVDDTDRSFAQLMGQMTGVRERLRDLPDSERRAGAEQMALQMMQLLGIDGSDDGTEGSMDAAPPNVGQQAS